jgi:hypothetical protein
MDTKYKSKKRRRAELKENVEFRNYVADLKQHIVTTRFNDTTWKENADYRKSHSSFGCIYGVPDQVCGNFKEKSIMFVLEMNNSINRIMGIGMVANICHVKKYRIYEDDNYNRYAYVGKYRIDRTTVSDNDEIIFQVLDHLCFMGSGHQKKLTGIKGFTLDKLFKLKKNKDLDLVDYMKGMFKPLINTNVK